jgi:hypothetical protein
LKTLTKVISSALALLAAVVAVVLVFGNSFAPPKITENTRRVVELIVKSTTPSKKAAVRYSVKSNIRGFLNEKFEWEQVRVPWTRKFVFDRRESITITIEADADLIGSATDISCEAKFDEYTKAFLSKTVTKKTYNSPNVLCKWTEIAPSIG